VQVVALQPPDDTGWSLSSRSVRIEPVAILRVALLLLCVSNLIRMPVAETAVHRAPIILNDIFAGLLIAAGSLVALRTRTLRLDDVTLAGLMFAAVGGLSALAAVPRFGLTGFEVALSLAYLARWLLYLGVYVVVINYIREADVGKVWSSLEAAILLFAAFGILQSIFLPNFAQRLYPEARLYFDHDPQGHRLVSTILDPNLAAAMILTVLLVQLAQLSAGARVAGWKPALLLVALMLTLSRSGILALLVGVAVIVAVRGVSKGLLRFAMVGMLVLLALAPRILQLAEKYSRLTLSDASAASRVVGWGRAISTFLDHQWIGIGFNTYGFVQERRGVNIVGVASYSVEGGLLFIAVMTGIAGVLLYSGMLWRVVKRCRSTWRMPAAAPHQRGLVIGVAAVTIAMVVDSLFVNSLLTTFVMEPMLVLWGLAFIVARQVRRQSATV
jgi:O-antigen ligase